MKKQSIIWIIICFILVLSESCSINKLNHQKERNFIAYSGQPNIILITISSLRADHVSCAGYNRQTTHNFDRFAKGNILFTNAFATSSWQMPAVGSIFTSLYPTDHGSSYVLLKEIHRNNQILFPKDERMGAYPCAICQ